MAGRSTIYFSARANAYALLAGAPALSVRRRMIHAALMHDDVVVDDGLWIGRSGPTGTSELRIPAAADYDGPMEFDTARQRARAAGSQFYVAIKRTGSEGPVHPMVSSKTTIGWHATFEPIKRQMPRAYPWLHFGSFDLHPGDKRVVSRMVADDERDGILTGLIADEYPRRLVIGDVDYALVLGSRMDAAVSMDAMHSRVVAARLARGAASPVLGTGALAVAFPSAGGLTWEEVDEARRLPGLRGLRARLSDIEATAWEAAEAGRPIETRIMDAYVAALHDDIEALKPSFRGAVVTIAIGVGISLATGPLPLVVGAAAGAAEVIGETVLARVRYERSWMAAADHVRKITRRPAGRA